MASIKQYRGKTWRAIIRHVGQPSKSKTFPTKREAELWVAQEETTPSLGTAGQTVRSIFERYSKEVAAQMRGRNEVTTVIRLAKNAKFMVTDVSKIKPEDIRDWRDARVMEVAPATVHREMNTMSAVFTHAIKEWSVPLKYNPCHLVTRFKNADKPRNKVWTDDDVQSFLKAVGWRMDAPLVAGRDYLGWALLLALETAMRIGELCKPTVADFYPSEKRLHLVMTKNGSARDVPLSSNAVIYLTRLCEGKKPSSKIIPLTADTLGEYMLAARKKCNLTHLVTHDVRHTAATRMSKKLSNVLELAAVTGHQSLKSLKRYYHPNPADLAQKLG